jgi:FixJ family two-component response regulator
MVDLHSISAHHELALPPAFIERGSRLSKRECQVLGGILDGMSDRVIAGHLGISLRSAVMYRRKMMHKLESATHADLLRMFEKDCS